MSVMHQWLEKYHNKPWIYKSLATLLVAREALAPQNLPSVKSKPKNIARPQRRKKLAAAIAQCELLGCTQDDKTMYLYECKGKSPLPSPILKEIGRLREIAFRAVGEGSNKRRDIDKYDRHYFHLILWDKKHEEIVGAYRFGDAKQLTQKNNHLYSATLFQYQPAMQTYFDHGLELGRSFIQPKYWGKRSLDYLWFGIGAFLKTRPHYRYLFGPVSLSNDMPDAAKDLIVHFYQHYFPSEKYLASANRPYPSLQYTSDIFSGNNYKADFIQLKSMLADMDTQVPTLYKQYTDVFDEGGVQFLSFSIDPDFNDCVDGLIMADMHKIKVKKRQRYMAN